jgi:hypothetical protein
LCSVTPLQRCGRRTAHGAGEPGEPWISLERARQLVQAGRQDEAVMIWRQIAAMNGLESRHTLRAWHFLRQAGQPPPADPARLVLGAAVEMPVLAGHDLLVAYRDGSARYLNSSGKVLLWEARSDAEIEAAITGWLAVGRSSRTLSACGISCHCRRCHPGRPGC